MDRGYANFHIESTQVAIAPEKDDIFITVNVHEGEVYKVGDVKLAGTMVVPEVRAAAAAAGPAGPDLLAQADHLDPGTDVRSGSAPTATRSRRSTRCRPRTRTHKTIDLTFFVDPGNRVYVRHVNFTDTSAINDEVLRREMRQLEGG